jgi:hypothetical protein
MLVDKRLNMYITDMHKNKRPHSTKQTNPRLIGGFQVGRGQLPTVANNTFYNTGSHYMKDKAMMNTFVIKNSRLAYTSYKSPFLLNKPAPKSKLVPNSGEKNVLSNITVILVYRHDVFTNNRARDNEEIKFKKGNIKNLLKNNLLEFCDSRFEYNVDTFNEKKGTKLLGYLYNIKIRIHKSNSEDYQNRLNKICKLVEKEEEDQNYNDFEIEKQEDDDDIYKENFDVIEEDNNEENHSIKEASEKSISLDNNIKKSKHAKPDSKNKPIQKIKEKEIKSKEKVNNSEKQQSNRPSSSKRRFDNEDKLDKLVYDEIERKVLSNNDILSNTTTTQLKQVNFNNNRWNKVQS